MKHATHLRTVTQRRPSSAALSPIWEFIYISESLLGLFGTFASFGLQFLGGFTSLAQVLADLKAGPPQT
jgi:hypothetical protein